MTSLLFFGLGFLLGALAYKAENEREKRRSSSLGRVFSESRRSRP
jgi:hypothetical protein